MYLRSQIDTNIIDINHITKVKKEAANIRHYGHPEGKQGLKDKYANDNLLKVQPKFKKYWMKPKKKKIKIMIHPKGHI